MSLRNCLLALATSAIAFAGGIAVAADALPPPDRPVLAEAGSLDEYRVGPKDVLDVTVFQVPELTRPVTVDASGRVSLPLIGAVPVAGKTTQEIERDLAAALSQRHLQSPEVSVSIKEFTSQRVTVDGAVNQPGVYALSGKTTLLQAVALAKGADKVANEKEVVVFRTVDGRRMAAKFDLAAIREGKSDDPQIYGNDVIVIERSGAKALFRELLGALPIFSVFRPY